jgi:microcystin-dependent protein
VGDGSTTFNLPDLRGRVVAGQDDMGGTSANRLTGTTGSLDGDTLGATGGTETHTLTISEMPSHNHTANISTGLFGSGGTGAVQNGPGWTFSSFSINNTGGGAAHNNVQPTIILNYIIYTAV